MSLIINVTGGPQEDTTGWCNYPPAENGRPGRPHCPDREPPERQLLKVLRPLLVSMRIAGLYVPLDLEARFPDVAAARAAAPSRPQRENPHGHFEDYIKMKDTSPKGVVGFQNGFQDGGGRRTGAGRGGMGGKLTLAYCVILLLLTWAVTVKTLLQCFGDGSLDGTLRTGMFASFALYSNLLGTFFLANGCRRTRGWVGFFSAYGKVRGSPLGLDNSGGGGGVVTLTRRKVWVVVALSWVLIAANAACNTYLALSGSENFPFLTPGVPPGSLYSTLQLVLVTIAVHYLVSYWIVSSMVYLLLMSFLAAQFSSYSGRLAEAVSREAAWFCETFTHYRTHYQHLSYLVDACDSLFCGLMASSLILKLAIVCCGVYVLMYGLIHVDLMWIIQPFWTLISLGYLFSVVAAAAWVKQKADEPLDILHDLQLTTVTPEFAMQLEMFTKKIAGGSVGISAAKMLVVDKNICLTMVGMLITYFILLVQFRLADSGATSCDCSELIANLTHQCF